MLALSLLVTSRSDARWEWEEGWEMGKEKEW